MFYSSPRLPDWPKQQQISRTRALIPARLVGRGQALNVHAIPYMKEVKFMVWTVRIVVYF